MAIKLKIPKASTTRKNGKRAFPRDPVVRASLIAFFTLSILMVGAFSYFYVKYDRAIEKRFSSPVFSNSSILTTVTSGAGLAGCTMNCTASINGFLAGNGATHLGVLYQFNTASAAKTVSGAAAFAR